MYNYWDLLSEQDDTINDTSNCVDALFDLGFYPLINIPTRITATTAKVLDHCWTNINDMSVKSGVILEQISDHLPVFFNFKTKITLENNFIEKRIFSEKKCE